MALVISQPVRPMLATLSKQPFDHPDWLFEAKWDGFRAIAEVDRGDVNLYSRHGRSFAERFRPIVAELAKWKRRAVLDGEIVILDEQGRADFQALQNCWMGAGRLAFYVFDLLGID